MRYFLYCFLCLFLPAIAFAQFTGIDSKNFPMIRAYGGGTIFANAKTSDFIPRNVQSLHSMGSPIFLVIFKIQQDHSLKP